MDKLISQPGGSSFDHNMIVHFHVTYGSLPLLEAGLKAASAAAKQRELIEAGIAVAKHSSQKMHAQSDVVSIAVRILNGFPNFLREFGSKNFVCIQEKDPVICQRKRVHGPLTFLGPAAVIVKLHDFRAKGAGDMLGFVAAAGIGDVDFTGSAQRFQAARQVEFLVAYRNDHAHGQGHKLLYSL